MSKLLILTMTLTFQTLLSFGQGLDSLKLFDSEIPNGYKKVDKIMCKTVHSASLYDQAELYSSFLGNVTNKEFQSFQNGNDNGTILYFEFEKYFIGHAFLMGLLWGEAGKPTRQKPDEFKVIGKTLVIWSFDQDSEIKKVSQAKIDAVPNKG